MQVQFYVSTYDPITVDKSGIQLVATEDCAVTENCDILRPVLRMMYNPQLAGCNYAYIPLWKKYYFITTDLTTPATALNIGMEVDPLYSNLEELKEVYATVTRSENAVSNFITDNLYTVKSTEQVTTKYFSENPFKTDAFGNNMGYVLTVIGGTKSEVINSD